MSDTRLKSSISSSSMFVIAVLAAIVGFGLLAWGQSTDSLPVVITGCVVSLIAAVIFLVIVFSFHDLEDRTQALGLPEGSVRALIALILLVIFAVFASAFFSRLSEKGETSPPVAEAADTKQTAPAAATAPPAGVAAADTTGTTQTTGTTGTPGTTDTTGTTGTTGAPGTTDTTSTTATTTPPMATATTGTETPGGATPATVSVTPSNLDFARQVLAILGTLLTAVISFYFGARSSTTAASEVAAPAGPTLTIAPRAARQGSVGQFEVTGISGTAKSASLQRGERVISGQDLLPATKGIVVTFEIPTDAATGLWDLVVELDDAKKMSLAGAVTVT